MLIVGAGKRGGAGDVPIQALLVPSQPGVARAASWCLLAPLVIGRLSAVPRASLSPARLTHCFTTPITFAPRSKLYSRLARL